MNETLGGNQILDQIFKPLTKSELKEIRRQSREEVKMLLEKGYEKGTREFKLGRIILSQEKRFGLQGQEYEIWLHKMSQEIGRKIKEIIEEYAFRKEMCREIRNSTFREFRISER